MLVISGEYKTTMREMSKCTMTHPCNTSVMLYGMSQLLFCLVTAVQHFQLWSELKAKK